jgi:hypothetical protein
MRKSYESVVRVVSALLYAFDPLGMGSTVFAPDDEYDDQARRLVSAAARIDDLEALVRTHFPGSTDQLVGAVVASLELYFEDRAGGGATSEEG